MKYITTCLIALTLASCAPTPTPFKEKDKESQLIALQTNVADYLAKKKKESDLAVSNYYLAYQREMQDSKHPPVDDAIYRIDFLDGKKDSAEIYFWLANSSKYYAKNKAGHPAQSTGIHFKIDENGNVKGHTGFLLYYGTDEKYVPLTGANTNLLYNSYKQ